MVRGLFVLNKECHDLLGGGFCGSEPWVAMKLTVRWLFVRLFFATQGSLLHGVDCLDDSRCIQAVMTIQLGLCALHGNYIGQAKA